MMSTRKRPYQADESTNVDAICHAVKRLHTTSSTSMSSDDAFEAYDAAEYSNQQDQQAEGQQQLFHAQHHQETLDRQLVHTTPHTIAHRRQHHHMSCTGQGLCLHQQPTWPSPRLAVPPLNPAPEVTISDHTHQQISAPYLEDVALYEQTNCMLKQLYFERLQRRSDAADIAAHKHHPC